MFVYKELKASDIAVVPFNAHKQYTFDLKGHSDSLNHIYFVTHSWAQRPIENYTAANCGHRQLEHLFYGRYHNHVSEKFGNANYIHEHRELGEEIYVYSIPQDTYGVQIKPKSLELETTTIVEDFRTKTDFNNGNKISLTARFIDDGIGNIWHLESAVGSGSQAFTTESFPNSLTYNHKEIYNDDRIFYLNPINGYKLTDLERDQHGVKIVRKATHSISYDPNGAGLVSTLPEFAPSTVMGAPHAHKVPAYNKEDVYEDSYYRGLVDYNNIRFSKYQYFPNYRNITQSVEDANQNTDLKFAVNPHTTFMDFHHQLPHHLNVKLRNQNHRGGSYLKSPNNEKFHFNPGDNFTINFNLKPVPYSISDFTSVESEELHIIGKSTTKTVVASELKGRAGERLGLNISGANQEVEMPSEAQYPFEIFLSASANTEEIETSAMALPTPSTPSCVGGFQIILTTLPPVWSYGNINNRESNPPSPWFWDNANKVYTHPPVTTITNTLSSQELFDYFTTGTTGTLFNDTYLSEAGFTSANSLNWDNSMNSLTGNLSNLYPSGPGSVYNFEGFVLNPTHPTNQSLSSLGWNSSNPSNSTTQFLNEDSFINNLESDCTSEILTTINEIPLFSTIAGALAYAEANGLAGYHTHSFGDVVGYMGGASHQQSMASSLITSTNQVATEYHSLNFRRSDGINTTTVSTGPIKCHPASGSIYNITCQYSSSKLSIWIDGVKQNEVTEVITSGSLCGKEFGLTQNNANIYIGCQGGIKNFFTGSLQNISIYSRALKEREIIEHNFESKYIGTPVVGNIFYSTGLITITNPYYFNHFKHSNITSSISYKNTMPLVENEYQCTLDEHEFNFTNNVSTRCITNESHEHLANFATGSLWNPYITTIGLYNENYELLVVGKLGQPVRVSDETDSTFIVRWDS